MRLTAITMPYFYTGEGTDIADALRSGKFEYVHLRKPGCLPQQLKELIETVPADLRHRLTLHDCHEIASETGAGGIHLNYRNPHIPAGWRGRISRSIHSIEEIDAITPGDDYAFLSPVFPSLSKPGYRHNFDLQTLRDRLTPRIYALGGVTHENLPDVEAMGFAGAAMLTAAWSRPIDMKAFRLQLITDGANAEEVAEGARRAVDGGCRWVQIRMKNAPAEEVERVAKMLAPLRDSHGIVLLVDDHVELAARLDCLDGVHVGKNDMPVGEARRLLGPSKILGATANTFADLEKNIADGADYIGLGPLRFTTTKKNLSPVLGIEGYRDITGECQRRGLGRPVVAIGGITAADVEPLAATGVAGIAVSGTILRSPDPAAAAAELSEALQHVYN